MQPILHRTALPLLATLLISLLLAGPTLAADFNEPLTGMRFVLIKGGAFDMGDSTHNGYAFERPLHRVNIQEFYIGAYEVTFMQYDRFARDTNRPFPDDAGWGRETRPVINVSWDDAQAFAAWLSSKSGKHFRLPSEAEWEYAARAGTNTAYWWGNKIGTGNANCNGCGSAWDNRMTAPVGSFAANTFGLYDVHGNVYEWVEDLQHDSYDGAPTDGSAWLTGPATARVQRSSTYRDLPADVKTATRNWAAPAKRSIDCGFRLALDAQ